MVSDIYIYIKSESKKTWFTIFIFQYAGKLRSFKQGYGNSRKTQNRQGPMFSWELWLCAGPPEKEFWLILKLKKNLKWRQKTEPLTSKLQFRKVRIQYFIFKNNIPGKKDNGGFFCNMPWLQMAGAPLFFAAFKLGLPCIIISNQTSIESFFKGKQIPVEPIGKPVDLTIKTTMALAWRSSYPDFAPPHTVCLIR